MKAACQLKQPRGWFAAGEGFRRALGLLSDGAFKLFAWICLHAERPSGELAFERAALARSLGKSRSALGRHLAELAARRVCEIEPAPNQHRASRLRVLPAFWPYRPAPSRSAAAASAVPDGSCAAYVEGVRLLLARPACVQAPFTAADERLAEDWHRAGIPLETVRQALLLGCLRKSFALIDRPDAQPIGSLRYFEGPLEEVRSGSFPTAYWQHVESHLERCEQHWRTQPATAPSRRGHPGERP